MLLIYCDYKFDSGVSVTGGGGYRALALKHVYTVQQNEPIYEDF